jgi:hypothetical protein
VVALKEHRRDKISKWNILKLKRGEEYWKYEVVDSTYPIRFGKDTFKANKAILKDVPDEREFNDRHPIKTKCEIYSPPLGVFCTVVGFLIQHH